MWASDTMTPECPAVWFTGPDDSSPDAAEVVPTSGPVVARFLRPVADVTDVNLRVFAADGVTQVETDDPVCRDAEGVIVDCLVGPVSTAEISPSADLSCEHTFSASVNAGGVGETKVRWGQFALEPETSGVLKTPDCSKTSNDADSVGATLKSTWAKVKTRDRGFGRSYVREDRSGAEAVYRFTGSKISWITMMGPKQGKAAVLIDGVPQGTINRYAKERIFGARWTFGGLSDEQHTLVIKALGTSASRARGTYVVIDGFQVTHGGSKHLDKRQRGTTYGFGSVELADAFGGSYQRSHTRGAAVKVRFEGTGLLWRTVYGWDQGFAEIYVDGALWRTVKNFRKADAFSATRSIWGLDPGAHTVRIVVLGKAPEKAAGDDIAIDGFIAI
jgi:hypothetical protein